MNTARTADRNRIAGTDDPGAAEAGTGIGHPPPDTAGQAVTSGKIRHTIEAGAGGNPTATSAGPRSQRPALAILCAASLMIILDGTIVTVALPSIQRSLQFSSTSLTWVVNAHSAPRPG